MNKFWRAILAIGSMWFCLNATYAGIPNDSHPITFLGPTLRGAYTDRVSTNSAYSIAGEAGLRNFRGSATFGWEFACNQRIKATAEYLFQRITYPFFVGDTTEWVQQGAIGAEYVYDLGAYTYHPLFSVEAWLSHAPSRNLSTQSGFFINKNGVFQNFVDRRRIAGSDAGGIAPGISINPWCGGKVGVDLNYDKVIYDKKYSPSQDAIGFGGTAHYDQLLSDNVSVGLLAAIRKPFNNYQAHFNWINVPYMGTWNIGFDGAYTAGKNTLPSTWNVGVSVNYFADHRANKCRPVQRDDFLAWTADPAVYLPQVLAVPDERVTITDVCPFGIPTLIGTIPNQFPPVGVSLLDITPFFSGDNLTYSLTVIVPPAIPANTTVINPATGVITVTRVGTSTSTVSVTATNPCGSVTSNAFIFTF